MSIPSSYPHTPEHPLRPWFWKDVHDDVLVRAWTDHVEGRRGAHRHEPFYWRDFTFFIMRMEKDKLGSGWEDAWVEVSRQYAQDYLQKKDEERYLHTYGIGWLQFALEHMLEKDSHEEEGAFLEKWWTNTEPEGYHKDGVFCVNCRSANANYDMEHWQIYRDKEKYQWEEKPHTARPAEPLCGGCGRAGTLSNIWCYGQLTDKYLERFKNENDPRQAAITRRDGIIENYGDIVNTEYEEGQKTTEREREELKSYEKEMEEAGMFRWSETDLEGW